MAGDSGMIGMQPVDRIDVKVGSTVTLEPGGYHLMLMGVTVMPAVGETVELTLTFETRSGHRRPGGGPGRLTWRSDRTHPATPRSRPRYSMAPSGSSRCWPPSWSSSSRSASWPAGPARHMAWPRGRGRRERRTECRRHGSGGLGRRDPVPRAPTSSRARARPDRTRRTADVARVAPRRPGPRLLRVHPLRGRVPGHDRHGRGRHRCVRPAGEGHLREHRSGARHRPVACRVRAVHAGRFHGCHRHADPGPLDRRCLGCPLRQGRRRRPRRTTRCPTRRTSSSSTRTGACGRSSRSARKPRR